MSVEPLKRVAREIPGARWLVRQVRGDPSLHGRRGIRELGHRRYVGGLWDERKPGWGTSPRKLLCWGTHKMTWNRARDLLPEGVKQWAGPIKARVMERIYRLRGKQVVHFLHVGKTGGTALKHALRTSLVTDRYLIKLHNHSTRFREIPPGDKVIFFLRDPTTRFVSGFLSRQRQGQPRYFVPWNPDEEEAFQEFHTPHSLALALSSPDGGRRRRAMKAMNSIQHLEFFCRKWFESDVYFLSRLHDVFFIGFQESMSTDFENLKSKLRLPDSVVLPTDNVEAHRNPDSSKTKLQGGAIRNLEHWYAQDYDFLRLCKEKALWVNRDE